MPKTDVLSQLTKENLMFVVLNPKITLILLDNLCICHFHTLHALVYPFLKNTNDTVVRQ